MKLAIMQPYFFPYLGYWQLIQASDTFVLMDDVQFIRHGWIERNRILKQDGGWQYVAVPLEKHSHKEAIRNIVARDGFDWKAKLLDQLSHYRRVAPHYREARKAIEEVIESAHSRSICRIDGAILRGLCKVLGVERDILIASECGLDYSQVSHTGEWALRISQQMGASEYINPIGGIDLFDAGQFSEAGIALTFLEPEPVAYERGGAFIPRLSIIDVLMFNGIEGTKPLLGSCTLKAACREPRA